MRGKSRYKRYRRLLVLGLVFGSMGMHPGQGLAATCSCTATVESTLNANLCPSVTATQVYPIPGTIDFSSLVARAIQQPGGGSTSVVPRTVTCNLNASAVAAAFRTTVAGNATVTVSGESCGETNFSNLAVDVQGVGTVTVSVGCSFISSGEGAATDSGLFDANLKKEIGSLNRTGVSGPADLIGKLIGAALGVIGAVTLLMLVYGGVMWMTAAGNSERSGKAIRIIAWAGVGAVVVLSSFTIVQFIFGIF